MVRTHEAAPSEPVLDHSCGPGEVEVVVRHKGCTEEIAGAGLPRGGVRRGAGEVMDRICFAPSVDS